MFKNLIFSSSNDYKIKQYQNFGLKCIFNNSDDLPEVLGNSIEVIVYKSKMAGPMTIVEDSIIIMDQKEIVDIKWKYKDFANQNGEWKTSIAINDGENIYVFSKNIDILIAESSKDSVGFEDNVVPIKNNPYGFRMHEIMDKLNFSARGLAFQKMLNFNPDFVISLDSIKEWEGEWQNA